MAPMARAQNIAQGPRPAARQSGTSVLVGLVLVELVLGWALTLTLSACGNHRPAPRAQIGPTGDRGHLILIGGGDKPAVIMNRFVELAGGPTGQIVVLPLASEDSRDTGDYYRDFLRQHGAQNIEIVHIDNRAQASDADALAAVRRADGVFFSGGDQRRIAERIVDTPMHQALKDVLARDGVIGGTSAGTACQSDLMLTGDGDFSALRADNIILVNGLGLVSGVILDQHFVARQRNNRLLSVILQHPKYLGVGVDEATAAWFRPDGTMAILGERWVIVYDASGADVTRDNGDRLAVSRLKQHILIPGQIFDLAQKSVILSPETASTDGP